MFGEGVVMPIAVRDARGRPYVLELTSDLTQLNIIELAHYKNFIKACLTKLPDSPVLQDRIEAIEREERWRAEDTQFQ